MDQLSPWYELYTFAPPHFPFCGEMVSGLIVDPVDTITSLFYTLIAYYIFQISRKEMNLPLKYFYTIPLVVSVGSTLFHISFTFVFLMADFLGIFILGFYGAGFNLLRLKQIPTDNFIKKVYLAGFLYVFSMIISYRLVFDSGLLMIPLILLLLFTERKCFLLSKKKNIAINYKFFFLTFFFLTIGYMCMKVEGAPFYLGCHKSHLHMHSWWHLFSALSFVTIFKFYQQFDIDNER